jgi:hypothetical protein
MRIRIHEQILSGSNADPDRKHCIIKLAVVCMVMVRLLAAIGQSVLVVAYTHSAVDTLLVKLNQHQAAHRIRRIC